MIARLNKRENTSSTRKEHWLTDYFMESWKGKGRAEEVSGSSLKASAVTGALGEFEEEENQDEFQEVDRYDGPVFLLVRVEDGLRTSEYKRFHDWIIDCGVAFCDCQTRLFIEAFEDKAFEDEALEVVEIYEERLEKKDEEIQLKDTLSTYLNSPAVIELAQKVKDLDEKLQTLEISNTQLIQLLSSQRAKQIDGSSSIQ